MKNKKVISEINRAREIMGLELLNEQLQPTFHLWSWCNKPASTVYYVGPNGLQGAQLAQASASFYTLMQSPSPGEIIHITMDPTLPQRRMCFEYLGTSTTAGSSSNGGWGSGQWSNGGPIRDPGSYPTCWDCQVGAMDWECTTPGTACQQTPNGTHPTQGACQAACQPALDDYECVNGQCVIQPGGQYTGPTAQADCNAVCGNVSCAQHGVDYDPVTGENCPGCWFTQGWNAINNNGNCNPTINKIAQIGPNCSSYPNWSTAKCQCRLDYLNFLLTLCQSNTNCNCCPASPLPAPNFITNMSTRWTNSIAANPNGDGCVGNPNNPNSGMCVKFKQFCPSSGPNSVPGGQGSPNNNTHACKCDYLWATYTCNC